MLPVIGLMNRRTERSNDVCGEENCSWSQGKKRKRKYREENENVVINRKKQKTENRWLGGGKAATGERE